MHWHVIKCIADLSCVTSDYGHLFDVQSELIETAANWRSIGLALHLKPEFLQNTEKRYGSDPRACLTWILMEWLMRNYNVERFGEPTWQRLVEVVGHPAGGADMNLARTIGRRHKAESRADITVAEEKTRKHKATGGAKKVKKVARRIKADCGVGISVAGEIPRKRKTAAEAIKPRKVARRHRAEGMSNGNTFSNSTSDVRFGLIISLARRHMHRNQSCSHKTRCR